MEVEMIRSNFEELQYQIEAITKSKKEDEDEKKPRYEKPQCKIEALKCPLFDGESTKYKTWKKDFQFVLSNMNVEPTCYSSYLLNSLRGEAARRISASTSVSTAYETIWKHLDVLYDGD